MSWELRPKEVVVDARSLIGRRIGGCSGDEFDEVRERCESLRKRFMPGWANDKEPFARAALVGKGGGFVGDFSVCLLWGTGADGLRPLGVACWLFVEKALVDARGVGGSSAGFESSCGGGILTGNGKSELRFLLRRGSLKNVVWVEMVCVVVVVEP